MAKVIIAIHGLRNKPPKELLETWAMLSIKEGLDNMNTNIELPKFEIAYWADILYDKPLSIEDTDPKSPYYIDEDYVLDKKKKHKKLSLHKRKSILKLKKIIYSIFLNPDYSLRFPSLAKKFIHNNFKELEIYFTEGCDNNHTINCEKRDRINGRLIELLNKHKDDDVFLVAHSMGSIIAFDVLSFIAQKNKVHTFVSIGSPLGAPFVVSRIAKLYKSTHQGHIKLQTPVAVTKRWCNLSDIRDGIALDHKLTEDFADNSNGVRVEDYVVINTYEKNGESNPHKSLGYIRTPEFINILVDFIKYS